MPGMPSDKHFTTVLHPTPQELDDGKIKNLDELKNDRYELLLRNYLHCNFVFMINQHEVSDL